MPVCPFADFKPIIFNITHGGRQRIKGFVPHVQVGDGSLYGFFNRQKPPGQGASADFWCSKLGKLEQYVDLTDQSWAQGSKEHNGNPYMVSCEFEGQPAEPMTAEQIDMGGRLIAWVQTDVNPFDLAVNTVPGNEGITPHHVFGGGHTCPGPGPREGQFPELITAARRWLAPTPAPTEEPDMLYLTYGGGKYLLSNGKIVPLENDLEGGPALAVDTCDDRQWGFYVRTYGTPVT